MEPVGLLAAGGGADVNADPDDTSNTDGDDAGDVRGGRDGLRRRKPAKAAKPAKPAKPAALKPALAAHTVESWKRTLLLVVAVTIHNFPEGLAVGVGFGAIGHSASATFESAFSLAVGIGIQNFPEGLAVSLPLRRFGYSPWKSFFYGQLSGMVEPLGGLLGAAFVQLARPALPYALSFAAGAMVYVVVDAIVPEAHSRGNSGLASWGAMVGFCVMMSLDVAL